MKTATRGTGPTGITPDGRSIFRAPPPHRHKKVLLLQRALLNFLVTALHEQQAPARFTALILTQAAWQEPTLVPSWSSRP